MRGRGQPRGAKLPTITPTLEGSRDWASGLGAVREPSGLYEWL